MRAIIQFIVLLLLVSGCKTTHMVTVYSLEPAPVVLAKNIKRIGIINEVQTIPENGQIESLDAFIDATDQQWSEEGKEAAIAGLFGELLKDQRFDTIIILENSKELQKEENTLEEDIPWQALKALCVANELDAIFSLAIYETDTRVTNKKSTMEELDLMRVKTMVAAREITLETLIENGWRIYDPFEKKVLDEIRINEELVIQAKGENAMHAVQAMTFRSDSLLLKSRGSGSSFGMRLKPYNKPIQREIYINGSENLIGAKAAIQKEDWLEAARLWQLEVDSQKAKIRAMACHNMAVLYELKNDLSKAIEWATLAQAHAEDKNHTAYLEALKQRSVQNSLAEQQLVKMAFLQD
jgi:hypothetical protein